MSSSRSLTGDPASRLLDAAERLFYRHGVQAVGVDAVVAEAGVATKTLYTHFGSKDGLVEAYLQRRHHRWLEWLRGAVAAAEPGSGQVLAVFDALGEWFHEPDFNGCAFINASGELPAGVNARAIARDHKAELRALLVEVAVSGGAADPAMLADQLALLVEGAIVTAHLQGQSQAAVSARSAAAVLLGSSGQPASAPLDSAGDVMAARDRR